MKLAGEKLTVCEQKLISEIGEIHGRTRQLYELLNMVQTALLITSFALQRTENRGTHYAEIECS